MVHDHRCENGLVLLIEEMPHVQSAAYSLLIPGGIVADEPERIGAALILAELTSRGAGELDSRALSDAFDNHGIRHSEGATHTQFTYRGSLLAEELETALRLVADLVRRPQLPEAEVENIRSMLLQDIASLQDHPGRRVMVELDNRYYPEPYCRPALGSEEGLHNCSSDTLRASWREKYCPAGAILSIAGHVQRERVVEMVERYFGGWRGQAVQRPAFGAFKEHAVHHIQFESAQLQIALAYPCAKFGDPHYYAAKVGHGILSGGMFGRLFIEVREKRGLCYSVYARHSATELYGTSYVYAGTTPERAQETLDVVLRELDRLREDIAPEELDRSKANLKSSLIIGEESSASRAESNAADWWLIQRVRSLEEILAAVDAVDIPSVRDSLAAYPARPCTLVTLGGRQLEFPGA